MATYDREDQDARRDVPPLQPPPPLPPALLEERIMRSLGQPSGQSSALETRTKGLSGWPRERQEIWDAEHDHHGLEAIELEESDPNEDDSDKGEQESKGGKTDADKSGAGDANLLKGFFGEA